MLNYLMQDQQSKTLCIYPCKMGAQASCQSVFSVVWCLNLLLTVHIWDSWNVCIVIVTTRIEIKWEDSLVIFFSTVNSHFPKFSFDDILNVPYVGQVGCLPKCQLLTKWEWEFYLPMPRKFSICWSSDVV